VHEWLCLFIWGLRHYRISAGTNKTLEQSYRVVRKWCYKLLYSYLPYGGMVREFINHSYVIKCRHFDYFFINSYYAVYIVCKIKGFFLTLDIVNIYDQSKPLKTFTTIWIISYYNEIVNNNSFSEMPKQVHNLLNF